MPPPETPPAFVGPVLFFDGDCGLCHRLVRGLIRLDRHARLRFAPLHGPAAQTYLRRHGLPTEDFDTLVYAPCGPLGDDSRPLFRTDGVIAALRAVGGRGKFVAGALAVFPRAWRDGGYRLVARSRHRLFGPWRPRPLARAEWSERFL